MQSKAAESLQQRDFQEHPVWQFVNNDGAGETMVRPIKKLPIKTLDSKLIAADFRLANGQRIFGYLSNVSQNPKLNEYFLTISVFLDRKTFHLARYFDAEYDKDGPSAIADFFQLPLHDIFPIEYDLTPHCIGENEILKGIYPIEPKNKLSLRELTMLAVPILPEYRVKQTGSE